MFVNKRRIVSSFQTTSDMEDNNNNYIKEAPQLVHQYKISSDNDLSPIPKQVDRYWKKRRVNEDDSDYENDEAGDEDAAYTSSLSVLLMKSSEERRQQLKQCWRLRCESFDSDDTDVATDQPEEIRDFDLDDDEDLLDATLASEFLAEINNNSDDFEYDKRLASASQESQQMEQMEQSDSSCSSVFEDYAENAPQDEAGRGSSLYSTDYDDYDDDYDSKMDISPEPNSPRTYISSFEVIMPAYPMDHEEAHKRPTENT